METLKIKLSATDFFRVAFGFLMLLDTIFERGLQDADIRFGSNFCFFPLFEFVKEPSVAVAVGIYSVMILGTLCLIFNKKTLFIILYIIPYSYFFLLDKSRWNNHSYLFLLISLILTCNSPKPLLKFQFQLVYFYAGVQKMLDPDWTSGWSMRSLGDKENFFQILKPLLNAQLYKILINNFIHLGGLIYDLSIPFLLHFKGTKQLAIFLSLFFHISNSVLFDIGMFPYVCIVALVLFMEEDEKPAKKSVATSLYIYMYIILQLLLPLSHPLTTGYNNWTQGLYGYSWDMMTASWETLHEKIIIIKSGEFEKYLEHNAFVYNDRWSSHADMAKQHASCIEARLKIQNISVHFDIWKSLNSRFQQRIFDPRVDILKAEWSPWEHTPWVLPLLKNYSRYRHEFEKYANDENYDAIFIADFPGLYLENWLPSNLMNVSLNLIDGKINLEVKGRNTTLVAGESAPVAKEVFHKVYPVDNVACYYYKFLNETSDSMERDETNEIFSNMETISRSFYLIINAWLNLLFNVPMVVRKKI